jgi:ribosome-binding factor A
MSVKIERLEQIIQKEVSLILQSEVKDPRISWVIVTDVELTNDLSFAKIFINFLQNDYANEEIMESLEKAKGFIRSKLSHQLTIRKVPQLIFEYDDSLDKGNRIDELLRNV